MTLSKVASAIAWVGVMALVVSLPLPFASNPYVCLDHCPGGTRWYAWLPHHNLLMPLITTGVISAVLMWRRPLGPAALAAVGFGILIGWLGMLLFHVYAVELLNEMMTYGTVDAEPHRLTVAILWAGWTLLSLGAVLASLVRATGTEAGTG